MKTITLTEEELIQLALRVSSVATGVLRRSYPIPNNSFPEVNFIIREKVIAIAKDSFAKRMEEK